MDAASCGVEIHRDVAERNAQLPENRRMLFRIGINLGDVLEEGKRIYGDGVNIAARMESLAEAGGICISGTVYDAIENKIGLEYEYLGEQEVKDIDKPVRAYWVLTPPGTEAQGRITGKRPVSRWWRKVAMIAGVVVLLLAAAGAWVWNTYFRLPDVERLPEEKRDLNLPTGPSVAVLPFVNMSGDPAQEYFSDGLTENIITGLSTVPQLFVIARNSTFFYKGKAVKVQEVAKELGVQYVVEGSVQKSNDRLRMTAQLIDAKTGHHVWAEHYDRDLKDVFAIQDEITIKIIKALRLNLTDGMLVQEVDRYPCSLDAFMKMMKAISYVYTGNKEGNILARQEAEQAMALAPQHPLPHSIVASSHVFDLFYGASPHPVISLAKATQSAKEVLALDDSYPPAYFTLASIAFARGEHEKAIRLNPQPQCNHYFVLGLANWLLGQDKKAIALCKKSLEQSPDYIVCRGFLPAIYMSSGQEEHARAAAKEVLRIDPEFSVDPFAKSKPFKNPADRERLIDALHKAGLK
ncbi:MAG: hypothetical protein JXL84_26625 [Deltaproteobacteria bacterium]|nr:hypothetical protein [Deltaproteobacteria bacterium]